MDEKILAWHFLRDDGTTEHGKTTPEPLGTEVWDGPLKMCRSGLHGCEEPLQALQYAPGSLLRCVELSGDIVRGNDKIVASVRRELWRIDATGLLREFACICAEDAMEVLRAEGIAPDVRSIAALAAARDYAAGTITIQQLAAAREAAWYASRAARDAAWYAAEDAARAAREAAWYAAEDAARAAAWYAAEDAARAARAARAAAREAAREAVREAVRAAQNNRLLAMVTEAHNAQT